MDVLTYSLRQLSEDSKAFASTLRLVSTGTQNLRSLSLILRMVNTQT